MSAPSAVEGVVAVRLSVADGAVRRADVTVRRPVAVSRALVGRTPDEAVRLVPLLFSLCGTAQGLAAAMACEAALGLDASPHDTARALMLDAETIDNHAWQIAMEWPMLLGERPDPHTLLELRAVVPTVAESLYPAGDGVRPGGGDLHANPIALHHAVERIAAWLTERVFAGPLPPDIATLADWASQGTTAAARLIARLLRADPFGQASIGVAALTESAPTWFAERLAADPGFSARPQRDGSAAHTGPLARCAEHPLVASVVERHGNGLAALAAARLADMAELPRRMAEAVDRATTAARATAATSPPPGEGCGVVETARGRLAHWLRLGPDGRIADYRTVAPTEWNFAADGPLARGLIGLAAGDDPLERARLLVAMLDPCVACTVTIGEG